MDGIREVESGIQTIDVDTSEEPISSDTCMTKNGVRNGMALWKSHGKNDTCQCKLNDSSQLTCQSTDNNIITYDWNDCDDGAENEDDDNEYSDYSDNHNDNDDGDGNNQNEPAAEDLLICADVEDWDKEIEDMALAANPYETEPQPDYGNPYEPDMVTYQYLGTDHVFLPSMYHAKPVSRFHAKPFQDSDSECGQFDDVLEEELPGNGEMVRTRAEHCSDVNHTTEKQQEWLSIVAKIS